MKKRNLLFCGALLATVAGQAIESPYTGVPAGLGNFYLYQVETGTWLDDNMTNRDWWTTHGQLDSRGFDIELRKPDETFEGYSIFCFTWGNGSLNGGEGGGRLYMDVGGIATDWTFEPVEMEGVPNAYHIVAKAKEQATNRVPSDITLGADANGNLSVDEGLSNITWQLVTHEERIAMISKQIAQGEPVDASWVIPGGNFGRRNDRLNRWNYTVANNYGGGDALEANMHYPVKEYWHRITMNRNITLTGLPNGTYEFSVQGYYRDGDFGDESGARFAEGTETMRAFYYAGGQQAPFMSIWAGGKDAEGTPGYTSYNAAANKWVPNSMGDASVCFENGGYENTPLKVVVTDGTLTIGIDKPAEYERDWFVHKHVRLFYLGQDGYVEDLTDLKAKFAAAIAEGETLPTTPGFIAAMATANEAMNSTSISSSALRAAYDAFKVALNGVKDGKNAIQAFNQTLAITDKAGINTESAQAKFNAAKSKAEYEAALRELRYNRRRAVAQKQPDVFPGQVPAAGNYYLYNVGQQQFLCGGSDWGAHAALNLRGKDINLEDHEGAKPEELIFDIETGLVNGVTGESGSHYLGYRGYMDSPKAGGWQFIPVEGKEGVYNIVQADYPDAYIAWNPYASTDQGNNDETTVGTENRNFDPADPNGQWKLVTAAEREALLEKATVDNPVDATIYLVNPGFNQREDVDAAWALGGFNVAFRGSNRPNFVAESYVGAEDVTSVSTHDLSQMVVGLPAGVYVLSLNGYYRYGEYSDQVNCEPIECARAYAGMIEVNLPNILRESFKAPGEGDTHADSTNTVVYQCPNSPDQAGNYFKSNLYPVNVVFETAGDEEIPVGVYKPENLKRGEWTVVDNFRLTAYGNNTTVEAVQGKIDGIETVINTAVERPVDNRIFNMQGIQVKNANAPGIYIRNGRKFVVK